MPRPRAKSPKFSLTQRGERWYVQWWQDGRAQRVSTGTADEREAQRFLAAHAAGHGTPAPPEQPTIGQILDGYLEDRKERVASHATLRYAAAAIKGVLADLTPENLTQERVRHYADQRRAAGRKDGTIIREMVTLRAALRWAVKAKWITDEPHVEVPSTPVPRDRWLTRQEAAKLIKAAETHHVRLFIVLALHTAARAGAILALQWSQVDMPAGRINLGRGSGNKRRSIVPINVPLREELEKAQQLRTCDFVVEFRGSGVASVKTGFAAAVRRAKLKDITPHTMRHTAATWMAQKGISMARIASFLGNSEVVTENVYAHHHPDYMREAAEALE